MNASRTSPSTVVLLGALSTIAVALARRLAADGAHLVIAGRGAERLSQMAADLEARGAGKVVTRAMDFVATPDAARELDGIVDALGGSVDAIVVIYGMLGDQRAAERDLAELDLIIDVNFASAARWCVAAAGILERQKNGVLVAVSSVAGDRGRQSNYVYGAAKAGLATLVEGLAHKLAPSGARAVAVKLGQVDTAMTAHIDKRGPLWAKPDAIALQLQRIIAHPTRPVVYLPWFWRPVMSVIRNIPTPIFHRTRL